MAYELFDNGTNVTSSQAQIYTKVVGSAIFVIVWPFIVLDMSFFPLGRPAAALVGAALMVVFQVISQDEVYDIIEGENADNLRTIFLLVGMMMMSYYYDREGLLMKAALKIFGQGKPFHTILWKVCVMSALLSAFITNDAACLVLTPLLLTEFVNQGRDSQELLPLCLGIATSANIGSAATFFGNPQNAYIASKTGVNLVQFFISELPAALLGLAINVGLLYLFYLTCYWIRSKTKVFGKSDHEHSPLLEEDSIHTSNSSLADERRELAESYDRSRNPASTSQMSIERERMRSTRLPRSTSPDHLHQSNLSSASYGSNITAYRRRQRELRASTSIHVIDRQEPDDETILEESSFTGPESTRVTPRNSGTAPATEVLTKCDMIRQKLFIVWLLLITVLMIVLLALPSSVAKFDLGCVPIAAGIFTMLADTMLNRKYAYDVMSKIDWSVILMFMGLFVWLEGFKKTNFPNIAFDKLAPHMNIKTFEGVVVFSLFIIVASNVFSNVPLVILVVDKISCLCGDVSCDGPLGGLMLAWISTIAGNFTLIGSVANLIVAEKARKSAEYRLSFWSYFVFGFPSTLLILYTCLPIVYFMGDQVASRIKSSNNNTCIM